MEEELKYLSDKLQVVEMNITRDLGYGHRGDKIAKQLKEQKMLRNIISVITISELNNL